MAPNPRKKISIWKIFFFLFACLVTAFFGLYSVTNVAGKKAWKKANYQMRTPTVGQTNQFSPGENFAEMPAVKKFFETFYENKKLPVSARTNTPLPEMLQMSNLGRFNFQKLDPKGDLPGSWIHWKEKAIQAITKSQSGTYAGPGPEGFISGLKDLQTEAEIAAYVAGYFLKSYGHELEELQKYLPAPHSQYPIHYQDGFAALLPHLSFLKASANALHLAGRAELTLKQKDPAAKKVITALLLSQTLREEPLLVSQLVRSRMVETALDLLEEGWLENVWTSNDYANIEAILEKMDLPGTLEEALRFEQDVVLKYIEESRRTRNFYPHQLVAEGQVQYNKLGSAVLGYLIPSGWFYHNMAAVTKAYDVGVWPVMYVAKHRFYPKESLKLNQHLSAIRASKVDYFLSMFAVITLPGLEKGFEKVAYAQAKVDMALWVCRLEQSRMNFGKYPDSLQGFASGPHDIVSGEPYRYRLSGDRFHLYSMGWNEIDDGGIVADKRTKKVVGRGLDWVWSQSIVAQQQAGKQTRYLE